MYTSFHSVVGGTIMLVAPDPVSGAIGAFLSHFLMDYIGEAGYGSEERTAAFEIPLLMVYAISALLLDSFWLLMLAMVMSNLPDIIDKPRRIIFGKPEWFSCHNGKGLFSIGNFKLGYPILVRLDREQTEVINVSSIIAFFLVSLLSYFL